MVTLLVLIFNDLKKRSPGKNYLKLRMIVKNVFDLLQQIMVPMLFIHEAANESCRDIV